MEIKKYKNYWAVYDDKGEMVCVTVYKKGAREVKRRMEGLKRELNREAGKET